MKSEHSIQEKSAEINSLEAHVQAQTLISGKTRTRRRKNTFILRLIIGVHQTRIDSKADSHL